MSEFEQPADPYRYGRPEPVTPSAPTGREIIRVSWALLRQDRQLLWLPVISMVSSAVAAALLFLPGFLIGDAAGGSSKAGVYLGGLLAAFALSVVGIYFQAALVIGAYQRADGRQPTLGGVLGEAWQLKGKILAWAVVTTTVGAAIRAVEQRLGIFGRLLGFLGGITWAIATFFVVPVVVAERLGPIDAVKRSASLLRETWGTSLRSTLRLGIVFFLLALPILVVGFVGIGFAVGGAPVVGVVLIVLAALAFVGLGSVAGAVTTYARAMIYRFAVGRPVPGMSPQLIAGAFAPKRRRGRR